MTIHSLLRHVGIDVPDFIFVGEDVLFESKSPMTTDEAEEAQMLMGFMNGRDSYVLRRLVVFFSKQTGDLPAKYLHPRELREFWSSLTMNEREHYKYLAGFGEI